MEVSTERNGGREIADPTGHESGQGIRMRAIVQDRYGPPEEVLKLDVIDRPAPGDGAVLVRVRAAVVGGTDWHLLRACPMSPGW